MDFYKNLPAPARIAIPAVIGLLVLAFVYLQFFKPDAPVAVVETNDPGIYIAAQKVLKIAHIPYFNESDATKQTFVVKVSREAQTAASDALADNGVKDLSENITKIKCQAAPGFTATKAANDRADNCTDSKQVQNMLLTAGASAANVIVSRKENDTLLGAAYSKTVLAQVFLSPSMKKRWNAADAASSISSALGTPISNITISDSDLGILFNGSKVQGSASGTDANSASSVSSSACKEMASATEIATKEAAVRSCYEYTISEGLNKLLGDDSRYALTVNARVDARSRTSQFQRSLSKSGSSSSTGDPDTVTGGEVKPAGDISMLALTVALDQRFVNQSQELAVKRLLSTYVDPTRKDPAPRVTRYAFPTTAKKAASTTEDTNKEDQAAAADTDKEDSANALAPSKTPKGLIAFMGLIITGLFAAILILWHRSNQSAKERLKYEDEFRNQQRVLDTFAQQDPSAVARDLEALLGTPPEHQEHVI